VTDDVALVVGNNFTLFNKAHARNFATVTLPALGPDLAWQNNLVTPGSPRAFARAEVYVVSTPIGWFIRSIVALASDFAGG
jgi:hypothetical protein